MKFLYWVFVPKQKPLQTVHDEHRKKPELKTFSTIVPQSYLDKTKKWDEHLYNNNKSILKD